MSPVKATLLSVLMLSGIVLWGAGIYSATAAGVRPGVALDLQDPEDLIWIRGEFHRWPELYEKVVVHGHTPAAVPEIVGKRVNLDTGAWQSGILTALAVDGQDKRIMQVEG